MAIYLFYVCRGGAPELFEAYDLADDVVAWTWAPKLLDEHRSCDSVEVCQGERNLGVLRRGSSARPPLPWAQAAAPAKPSPTRPV